MVGLKTHFFFMELGNELQIILDTCFRDSDYKIIDIIFRGDGRTKVLEIFVDNKNGISIDDLAGINRELNALVDSEITIKDITSIIVSSPGAERPFRFIWQLIKHIGRTLEVELNNDEKFEGTLEGIPEQSEEKGILNFEIPVFEKKKFVRRELREINFKDIKEIKVKISFSKNKNK